MGDFRALQLRGEERRPVLSDVRLNDSALDPGSVMVRVEHSTLNYKDALAITGRGKIVRRWPIIPGIDFAGVVEVSDDPNWRPGDRVVLTGWGVGEEHNGGLAERARVPAEWLTALPDELTTAEAMAIGTAGFTAMLCVLALDRHGLTPASGPVLVTGASGGVGSVAVAVLAELGFEVTAATGRAEAERHYLRQLGAKDIIERAELEGDVRPLGKARWAAAVDPVGGRVLANVLSMIRPDGAVAACGNAGGMDLPTNVAPFILRGVSLLGINSVQCPPALRRTAWARLARDLDRGLLAAMTSSIGLSDVAETARRIVDGEVRGRVRVDIAG